MMTSLERKMMQPVALALNARRVAQEGQSFVAPTFAHDILESIPVRVNPQTGNITRNREGTLDADLATVATGPRSTLVLFVRDDYRPLKEREINKAEAQAEKKLKRPVVVVSAADLADPQDPNDIEERPDETSQLNLLVITRRVRKKPTFRVVDPIVNRYASPLGSDVEKIA